ncbi:MAG: FAD-dependent protein [Bacteroidota bacterium]
MNNEINLSVSPENIQNKGYLKKIAARQLGVNLNEISDIKILKRSLDARKKDIKYNLRIKIFTDAQSLIKEEVKFDFKNVKNCKPVIIVGSGPAGLFAAMRLIQKGIKPVIIERGSEVSERKKDVADISRLHIINPDSNYCFGEGGAGTFSDGKLFTRSTKKGDVNIVLNLLCYHGADIDILIDSHPHIGTDKLPGLIKNIRNTILHFGGEMFFNERVNDFIIKGKKIYGVITVNGNKFEGESVILATGHSADDIYNLLVSKNIQVEPKAFAMGVRVEHPQIMIDKIQYHGKERGKYLPVASYSLVAQSANRGVYSFCMCPGGFVVPSATSDNEIVVNGMSPSSRNSAFANSGIVVEIRLEDIPYKEKYGSLAGLKFQNLLEKSAFANSLSGQKAPVQRLSDFVNKRFSQNLPSTSYFPGVVSSPLHEWLPDFFYSRLKDGFIKFDKMMKGFLTSEAVIYGVESRTSSPVRIVRDKLSMQHPCIAGLYPCGEGAGYAGGIVSSAIDGINCADRIAVAI